MINSVVYARYVDCKYGNIMLTSYPPQPGCSKGHYPICCDNCNDYENRVPVKIDTTNSTNISQPNNVNHPSHYNQGKYEVIDVIEDWQLDFCLGNAIKYIGRAGHKDDKLQDLEKAKWYLEREIENIKKEMPKHKGGIVV